MSDEIVKRGHEGLAGHDAEAPPQEGVLQSGRPPGEKWKTIASYSAEQTAAFLGGAPLGKPQIHDPELAGRLAAQQVRIRRALFDEMIPSLAAALDGDSAQTAHRLRCLSQASFNGETRATEMLAIMLNEMIGWGLKPS